MKTSYPIMVQLKGKSVVVVGGGKVAERKVSSLLDTGASIIVISPEATERLKKLASEKKVEWQQKQYLSGNLTDAFMIFAATDDRVLNQMIGNEAGDHQLVTMADDPEGSDFHVPAQLHRGRLTIAISTDGASPKLASQIREQLEQQFDSSYEDYLEFLYQTRQKILREVEDPLLKNKLLTVIVSSEFLNSQDREGKFTELYEKLRAGT
ncbi:NAD(P)-binding protein [Bacillus sp. MRMR6]|uniref:NAD(P)-binding protein n=1 Tax=Bacillus sp. MRMR6 TaxID=1928617 RepID=UPI000950E111|nr:NAD(P)-binding protein [Bacillus sp. MRMR6]OLS40889.1 siroheme synthase [Bacillus sp. MRMR6]